MKKMLLLTLVLLAVASLASAATVIPGTVSLAYNQCRNASTPATDNDFVWPTATPATPCADPTLSGTAAVIDEAFKNSAALTNFVLATSTLDILVGNGTSLPDFWIFDTGTCHASGLTASNQIQGTGGITLPPNCQNPYGLAAQQNSFGQVTSAATGRVHFENDHQRGGAAPLNLAVATATGGWISANLLIGYDDAAFDGNACAGCDAPACLVCNRVEGFDNTGAQCMHCDQIAPGIANFVTWYGGTANCPGAVPTQNKTWGAVKALYR